MKILSIHDGHCACLVYVQDGVVTYLLLEERFTGVKNQGGFPAKSLEWLRRQPDFDLNDLDFINIGCFDLPVYDWATSNDAVHRIFSALSRFVPRAVISSNALIKPYLALVSGKRRSQLAGYVRDYGLDGAKVRQIGHHEAHGMAALHGSGLTSDGMPVLIFTVDSSGDGVSSTVALWDRKEGYRNLHVNQSFNSVGYLYSRVTEFMGMKPGEHEYKIMGMAPYVPDKYSENVYLTLKRKYLDLDATGLKFIYKNARGMRLLGNMRDDFFLERFDNICAGAQRHFEDVLLRWISAWAAKTGVRRAVFGGGCFMNVKANMLISQLEGLEQVFFCPSSGDESTAIGSAYALHAAHSDTAIPSLGHLYKGPDYGDDEVEAALGRFSGSVTWERVEDIEARVADLMVEGLVVARFKGPAEWGARALGHRSILCRADDLKIIHKLNKSIKMRDFWMPFAASMRVEDADRYLDNPKGVQAPYMNVAFPTLPEAKRHLAAAIHPFDHTCRPQIVYKEWSPDYHRLLTLFKERTGMGGCLNTSFNLHGKPVVGTPDDALQTLVDSGLDCLAVGPYLARRG